MTNAEKFLKDEVSAREFREKLGQFIFSELGFYDGTEEAIDEVIGDFLDMIEKPILSEDEKVILKNIKSFTTIIRNIEGNIQVENEDGSFACLCAFNHLFQFIKERRKISDRGTIERRIKCLGKCTIKKRQ